MPLHALQEVASGLDPSPTRSGNQQSREVVPQPLGLAVRKEMVEGGTKDAKGEISKIGTQKVTADLVPRGKGGIGRKGEGDGGLGRQRLVAPAPGAVASKAPRSTWPGGGEQALQLIESDQLGQGGQEGESASPHMLNQPVLT